MTLDNTLKNTTLLYVEDDQLIRDELVEILEDEVANLYVATNGQEGLDLYKKFRPDIILTDIRMPVMDGLSMSQSIIDINPDAQIIISSAFNEAEYLLNAIKIGIHYYSLKPINLEDLFNNLDKTSKNIMISKRLKEKEKLLQQYKSEVDKIAIVSKTDKNGLITYANKAFCDISGYSEEELIGNTHAIVKHPSNNDSFFKDIWETILDKREWKGKIKNKNKNGDNYFVDSTIFPILNDSGEIEEFISIRKDITQEERYKQNLEKMLDVSFESLESKKRFIDEYENALQNNSLFCKTNQDGTIVSASKHFIELLDIKEQFNSSSLYLDLVEDSEIDKLNIQVRNSINTHKTWAGIVKHKNSKGETLYLQSSYIPITDAKSNIIEVMCLYTDLTDQHKLNKAILDTQREVISRMGAIGETRSKETGDHVKRVAEYSKLLALKYGLSHKEAEEIKMASPMHDIGKVAIPDNILNKPGKLTSEEFEIMKEHAQLGHDMLSGSNQPLLNTASIISQQHHEKWNGSGYPKGLSGEDIHIYGRITAIADVFDALGHDRVYKKAWPIENILNLFKEESGKHFDPNLIDIFMDNLDEFLSIKDCFSSDKTQ
ncbi:response regulator [Sulfurimonas sp.]|nr:response regulator [Sulfurimonas sp.]